MDLPGKFRTIRPIQTGWELSIEPYPSWRFGCIVIQDHHFTNCPDWTRTRARSDILEPLRTLGVSIINTGSILCYIKVNFRFFNMSWNTYTFSIIFAKPGLIPGTLLILALPSFRSLWLLPMTVLSFSPHCWLRSWATQDLLRPFTSRLLMIAPNGSWMTCAMHDI